nr:hypothetical protein [uncultured Vibrio sp.]
MHCANKCGQCRQFTREKANNKDICGAWGQPTLATRFACEFFMPAVSSKNRVIKSLNIKQR